MTAAELKRDEPVVSASRADALGIDPQDVVAFPEGLPGFEACRGFVLMTSDSTAPLQRLMAVEGPEASFLALDPKIIFPDYRYWLDAADLSRLQAAAGETLLWLALVTVETDGGITVNLRAPIVINPARMIGYQLMPRDCLYPLKFPVVTPE